MITSIRFRDNEQWHQWFAWHPIWIKDGDERSSDRTSTWYRMVWFQTIWRKFYDLGSLSEWEYSVWDPR